MDEDFNAYLQDILFTFICGLDVILTGKNPAQVTHNSKNQIKDVKEVVEDGMLYYLSDGGYSRVSIGLRYNEDNKQEEMFLILCSESTDRVKINWSHSVAVEIRTEIVNFLTAYLANLQLEEEGA